MVGRHLQHYRLLSLVGHGGMASVYLSHDEKLDRQVAIKVMHPHLASQPQAKERFSREAKAVARLRHENILEIYAASDADSPESYLVTEFVDGPTLRAFLDQHGPLPAEVVALIGWTLADALAAAHELGVVHRDVKPENVMVRNDGRLVLCDFGIARFLESDSVTNTGQLLGSPAYIAPEHLLGQPQDGRSDLFALGVLMYELLSGALPFCGRNPHETLSLIAKGEHTRIEEKVPTVPKALADIVEQLLAPEPDARFASARLLNVALKEVLRDSGLPEPREKLRAYFLDPQGFWQAFLPELLNTLVASGKARAQVGRTALALSDWGRVLALSPGHTEATALIAEVSRAGHHKSRLVFAAIAVCSMGVCMSVWFLWRPLESTPQHGQSADSSVASADMHLVRSVDAEKAASEQADAPSNADAQHGWTEDAATSPDFAPERAPGPDDMKPKPFRLPNPKMAPAPKEVRLEPWPKNVTVTHNGKRLGAYGTEVRKVLLSAAQNVLLFESPACYSETVTLVPGSAPDVVRVRLRWKPALLLVKAKSALLQPLPVDVLVDGRIVGRGGQVMAIPVSGDEGQQNIRVQISAPGHKARDENVLLRANQLLPLEVDLVAQ